MAKIVCLCAGLLCLALAYQLGSSVAKAQGCAQMVGLARLGEPGCYGLVAIDATGQAYEECGGSWRPTWRVPGTPVALISSPSDVREVFVLMQNGDIYRGHTDPGLNAWPPSFSGNVCSGQPTQLPQESFGTLKVRYR